MERLRIAAVPALLALLLFGVWLGGGWLHEHSGGPSCQICKLLHANQADLVRLALAPEPIQTPERVILAAEPLTCDRFSSLPLGRAPPRV